MFIKYLSPAKLNLGLKIVGIQQNGYHILNTVFCLINLYDEIFIKTSKESDIKIINHNQLWQMQNDLMYIAAKKLQTISNCRYGAKININKLIPIGAGLGGGSSNAATVLIALNQLWHLNYSQQVLIEIGKTIGADVAFFIYGKNAYATNIGDEFKPINIAKQYFVLVKPTFNISTLDVFKEFKYTYTPQLNNYKLLQYSYSNDLQNTANILYPELIKIQNTLQQYGKVNMTGSGSVLYLSFTNKILAKRVAKNLANRYNTFLVEKRDSSPLIKLIQTS